MKSSTLRTNASIALSMLLHSSAIALIALGPMIPGLSDKNSGNESSAVTVSMETIPASPVESATPAASVAIAPTPVAVTPAPAPVKKIQAKSKPLPEKIQAPVVATTKESEVAPQLEKADEEPMKVAEENVKVQEMPLVQEEKPAVQEEKPVALTDEEDAKEAIVTSESKVTDETFAEEKTPAAVAANSASTQSTSAAPMAAAASTSPTVTQNYARLEQVPGNRPPTYSRDARLKRAQGKGQLVYLVTKEGQVRDLKLSQSTGYSELDKAAIDAFSKYKFVPGQEGYTVHDFEFSLKGPSDSDRGRLRTAGQ